MSLPKDPEGLSIHDLRASYKQYSDTQLVSKTSPNGDTLKKWLVNLASSDVILGTRGQPISFSNIVNIQTKRQGIDSTTIARPYANNIYDYSLLKLGVHVGEGTAFPRHCSANELAYLTSRHRGGRLGGLFQNTADKIFAEGQKSDTGFVRVQYKTVDAVLHVAKPHFFVGAKDQKAVPIPDVLWGQLVKSDDREAAPAVQLSKTAQNLITEMKTNGLTADRLQDLFISPVPETELDNEQMRKAQQSKALEKQGVNIADWALDIVKRSDRQKG